MVSSDQNHLFLDQPEILRFIFYPRREDNMVPSVPNATNVLVPVDRDVSVGCRFYHSQQRGPNILFFHGNGEIVSDYDFIAPLYGERGLNLFVADYRGYGFSDGTPTTSGMIHDAHPIFRHFLEFLQKNQYTGPAFVMGRSLGSASAVELGSSHQENFQGIIIESGFANTFDLLKCLGIPIRIPLGMEDHTFSNLKKIKNILLPTLIIHAEKDHIIPVRHARDLYQASSAKDKRLVIIPDANHNNLLMVGQHQYFEALTDFVSVHRGQETPV
jgi:alpha-beta hydrolase superfamily lysophospholipase